MGLRGWGSAKNIILKGLVVGMLEIEEVQEAEEVKERSGRACEFCGVNT